MSLGGARAWRYTVGLVCGLSLGGAASVSAQRAGIGYHNQTWSSNELRPFHGGLLRIDWDNGAELSFEIGMARWADEGSTCSGLIIDPSDCVSEALSVGSETMAMGAGFSPIRLTVPGGELWLPLSAGITLAHLHRTGDTTGGKNEDSLVLLEFGLAVRYRTRPLWRQLVGFFAELRASAGTSITSGICADCYDPLRGDAARRSLLVGVAIGR